MAKKRTRRKSPAASAEPVTPSAALAEIVGTKPIPRTEVTKRLWAYIKKNGLQDARNRRVIRADAALKPVFGGKATVSIFEMTRVVRDSERRLAERDEPDPGLRALAHLYSKL